MNAAQTAANAKAAPMIINRRIPDFLASEYCGYAQYTLENRALPSVVDGFRVGGRKIIHAALNGSLSNKNAKFIKMVSLAGQTMDISFYKHGDASLNGTIISLTQDFKDNLAPLKIIGQNGTLRDPDAIPAPRYLHVQASPYLYAIYGIDLDMVEYGEDEGHKIEPSYYFPIIPTVITSRTTGMGVGYAFQSFSYNPLDIIDYLVALLGDKKPPVIRPFVKGMPQTSFERDADGNWYNKGNYEQLDKNTIKITLLPYDVTYDDFEARLNKLKENGYIHSWRGATNPENAPAGAVNYTVTFERDKLTAYLSDENKHKFITNLYLKSKIRKDNLTVLDVNGKIREFANLHELCTYFLTFRLQKYEQRKTKLVSVLTEQLNEISAMCQFIQYVIEGTIKINGVPQTELLQQLTKLNLPPAVLKMPVLKLTKEEFEKQLLEKKEILQKLNYIQATTTKDMYLNDLATLKKSIKKDF